MGPSHHPFVGSPCLLRTHYVPSSLGTERYTQPQPCPAGAYSPASWAQTGGRTAHLAGGSPAVFTLTSSVMPTASPHPATRISAMVIMGLCGIAQFSDPPHQLYLLAPSAVVLVHRLLDRGPGGGLATSHKCSANPHEMPGTRLRVGHRCFGLLLGSTVPHHHHWTFEGSLASMGRKEKS